MASLLLIKEIFLLLSICIIANHGQLRLANYLGDNMVLQSAPASAIIWGYGYLGAEITLSINNKVYHNKTSTEPVNELGDGMWLVVLDPESPGGPYQINVTLPISNGSLDTISINNVLFGDVWVCSGQSNMQMAVTDVFNGSVEIANAGNYPNIRLFTGYLTVASFPQEEPLFIAQTWSVASPTSVGGPSFIFASAVCWLYGRMIYAALGEIPIGLLATSWGGTAIEEWMPPEALSDCGVSSKKNTSSDLDDEPNDDIPDSSLYYGMIYPYTRVVIKGVIWYQGESNAYRNQEYYSCMLQRMIFYWRLFWYLRTGANTNINFPFGVVQLSTDDTTGLVIGGFPWIRWHQTFDVGYLPNNVVQNVFGAVTMDLRDDPNSLHPRTKTDVGYRLSRAGLAIAYNQNVEYSGPIVSSVVLSDDNTTIDITYSQVTAIEFRNNIGFEVCCLGAACSDDSLWVAALATSKNSLAITLILPYSCRSQPIYGVRYLWRETPCPFKQAAVYSATDSNLPSPPYLYLF